MNSNKPYLLRAFYEWISDNNMTPHVAVDASYPNVFIPKKYINEDGKVVLNISKSAVKKLTISNECLKFDARFSGIATQVRVPVNAVLAIYAQENGCGMVFTIDDDGSAADSAQAQSNDDDNGDTPPSLPPRGKPPKLTIVK